MHCRNVTRPHLTVMAKIEAAVKEDLASGQGDKAEDKRQKIRQRIGLIPRCDAGLAANRASCAGPRQNSRQTNPAAQFKASSMKLLWQCGACYKAVGRWSLRNRELAGWH